MTETPPTDALIDRLDRIKSRFGARERAEKGRLLRTLAGRSIRGADRLLRLHEALCFVRAYPDSGAVLDAADRLLDRYEARLGALGRRGAGRLDETGLAGTTAYVPLSYDTARSLARRFPGACELDWEDPDAEAAVATLLPALVPVAREETLVEVGIPLREWLRAARGRDGPGDLAWLLDRLGSGGTDRAVGRALYDQIQPRIRWRLGRGAASRTRARIPGRPVFFHRGALRPRGGPLGSRLPGPPVSVRMASPDEASSLRGLAVAAVAVRYREVHALTFADLSDVVLADAGRGVEIAWFGVRPASRLPLRAHYGYLILKSGVPIGYGDASLLFDRCDIAYNIFDTFRHGESGFVLFRLLGFVWRHLGARSFHLSPFQVGRGNEEALASGAFWFYYKLGFRPVRPDLRRLAAEEHRRLRRAPPARSTRETLARLAEGGLALARRGGGGGDTREFDAGRLARRAAGAGRAPAAVARALGVDGATGWRTWPAAERVAFARLAPILGLLPDLERWPARDRRAVVAIARAKGGRPEREYLRRGRAHSRLRRALLLLGAP